MIEFISPAFLVGLLSAAIPLVIHLSRSRRTKKLRLPTARFLTERFVRSYRMSRLQELLLLALRMLAFAGLALALAQPLLFSRSRTSAVGQATAIVLVVDDSASMAYVENGLSGIERAKQSALALIDQAAPDAEWGLVLAGRRARGPMLVTPTLTRDVALVRRSIETLSAKPLGGDLPGAMDAAESLLRTSASRSRVVFVLSDLQQSGLESTISTSKERSDIAFEFVPLTPKAPVDNVAVTALQTGADRPVVGAPYIFRPHVRAQGALPATAEIRLVVDGQKVSEQKLDPEKARAGRWVAPRLAHTFTKPGWNFGYVEVSDDRLTYDNRRYFAVEVLDSIRALVVNGAPSTVPRLDELFFLRAALSAAGEAKTAVSLDMIAPAELSAKEIEGYRLVILANVESIDDKALEKLEAAVDRGVGLLVFLGDRVQADRFNATFGSATRLHGGLVGGLLGAVVGDPKGASATRTIRDVKAEHPVLVGFDDPSFVDLTAIRIAALWEFREQSASVLARDSQGLAVLTEQNFGRGRVLLFTSTVDRDWTNFPIKPAFLVFVQRLLGYAAGASSTTSTFFTTGTPLVVGASALEGVNALRVLRPDQTVADVEPATDGSQSLVVYDTDQAGVYTAAIATGAGATAAFAGNLEGFESDLSYLAPDEAEVELKRLFPNRPLLRVASAPGDTGFGARAELWDWLLWLVLLVALVEPWLANRIALLRYRKIAADAVER